jgi:hypothetical protein
MSVFIITPNVVQLNVVAPITASAAAVVVFAAKFANVNTGLSTQKVL